jgi:hypothetical protein
MKASRKKKRPSAEKPISLKPLKFDEAVSDLLKVKPEPKGEHKHDEHHVDESDNNHVRR